MSSMTSTGSDLAMMIEQQIRVSTSLDAAFDALLEEMGPENRGPDDSPLPMKLEPWPGGRWFRDLGDDNGHLWGHVQAIKRPTLLELTGPLFISAAVLSNVQYRLTEENGEAVITLRHQALGFVPDDLRSGMDEGWRAMLQRVQRNAK